MSQLSLKKNAAIWKRSRAAARQTPQFLYARAFLLRDAGPHGNPWKAADVAAWQHRRNNRSAPIDWRFTTEDARIKLKRLFPNIEKLRDTSSRGPATAGRTDLPTSRHLP